MTQWWWWVGGNPTDGLRTENGLRIENEKRSHEKYLSDVWNCVHGWIHAHLFCTSQSVRNLKKYMQMSVNRVGFLSTTGSWKQAKSPKGKKRSFTKHWKCSLMKSRNEKLSFFLLCSGINNKQKRVIFGKKLDQFPFRIMHYCKGIKLCTEKNLATLTSYALV